MSVAACRIVKAKHAATAFDGEGARQFGGRWNSPGNAVVYTSASASLAALEMLVHLEGAELLQSYALLAIVIPTRLVRTIDSGGLPDDWRDPSGLSALRKIGDDWLAEQRSLALRVPCAIIDTEYSILINPRHPKMDRVTIGKPREFAFDRRLGGPSVGIQRSAGTGPKALS